MARSTLVSVEEYLTTSYEPDCDYVDGQLLERNVGEYDHGRLQGALFAYFYAREKECGIRAVPELRVQVSPTRFRVPDVCVTLGDPGEQILRKPPFLCIEILSPEDRMSRMMEKIGDYIRFGVPWVWVIDPQMRTAFVHTTEGSHEAQDGILCTKAPDFAVNLAEIFSALEE